MPRRDRHGPGGRRRASARDHARVRAGRRVCARPRRHRPRPAARRLHGHHGAVGLGQVDADAILAGLDRPTAGNVWVDGAEITSLKERALTQLRRDKIGFIFQTFNLLPTLNAEENIMLPLTIAGRKGDDGWVKQLIETVGLGDRLDHKPSELSGGQQQRVAVARALASRPAVLFADEPTGNLDSHTGGEVLDLLRHSCDDLGQTIVMVTHDAHAATYADRIVFLKDGKIAHDCGRLGRDDIYDVIKSLEDASRSASRGGASSGAQVAHDPDDAGDPAGRCHDQRHLRAHRPDRQGLPADLRGRVQGHRRDGDAGAVVLRLGHVELVGRAARDARADGEAGPGRRRRRGLRHGHRRRGRQRQGGRDRRVADTLLLDTAPTKPSSRPTATSRARRRRETAR